MSNNLCVYTVQYSSYKYNPRVVADLELLFLCIYIALSDIWSDCTHNISTRGNYFQGHSR